MKKSMHFILALALGLMIGASTTVFGEASKFVQASFEKFDFVVHGSEVSLETDPLVYEDHTYLPVRAVLHALGYDVGYDKNSRTITANKSLESLNAEMAKKLKDASVKEDAGFEGLSVTEKIQRLDAYIESMEKVVEADLKLLKTFHLSDEEMDEREQKIMQAKKQIMDAISQREALKAAIPDHIE